jgi:hypothetical protein
MATTIRSGGLAKWVVIALLLMVLVWIVAAWWGAAVEGI